MKEISDYKVSSLLDLIEIAKDDNKQEENLFSDISSFSCPKNIEIERFLKDKAIDFTLAGFAITYLVYDGAYLAGFFSLSCKSLLASDYSRLSNTLKNKVKRFSDYYESINLDILNAILIGQLGKNFADSSREITGKRLLEFAFDEIRLIEREVGGRLVCAECEDDAKLIGFYEANHFVNFQNRQKKDSPGHLVQMVRYM